jgi:hypothetical protein
VAASAEYEVTLDNQRQTFRMSGRDLATQGIPVRLFDTAGTRESVDPLEREGMLDECLKI